jgi:hypothetical protein
MSNQKDSLLSPEKDLKAENNLLKQKLRDEHGMQMQEASDLSPEMENEWLKNVYDFEQKFKDAKRVRIYDYIGRPAYSPWDILTPEQTRKELQRLELLMENNGVELSCLCSYDDATIYRFITEELFQHEMDDMRIDGMTSHFTYEEFHPNHDYDLRQHTSRFLKAMFTRPWDEEFDGIDLAAKVSFAGTDHDRRSISRIMRVFQEAHGPLDIEKLDINQVAIDESVTRADVHASLCVSGKIRRGDRIRYDGICSFRFIKGEDYWYIEEFSVPGLPDK